MFIDPIGEDEAVGAVAEFYAADVERMGYVPNYTKAFSLHPDAYGAWIQLIGSIRGQMDLRRCELATLAAARQLGSSYCSVAHGKVLRDRFHDAATVTRIATDHNDAGLDEVDVAVMDFAAKAARAPASITAADVDRLRSLGLSDRDVLDVVLAVGARCFFATVVEALGATADRALIDPLEDELAEVLLVGRRPD